GVLCGGPRAVAPAPGRGRGGGVRLLRGFRGAQGGGGRPPPPIVIGGAAEPALRRAAREGDGWYGFALTVEQTAPIVAELSRLRRGLGKGELEVSLTTFEPVTPELVAAAGAAGIHRLIGFPLREPAA